MSCPLCDYKLHAIPLTGNSGVRFSVDHCNRCGGTWFDPGQIRGVSYHEVVQTANRTVQPKKPTYVQKKQYCPDDHTLLRHFITDVNPPGVAFLRCGKCGGMWATQKTIEETVNREEIDSESGTQPPGNRMPLRVVFIPAVMFLLLVGATFTTVSRLSDDRDVRSLAQSMTRSLAVTPLDHTSVIISFETDTPQVAALSYGTNRFFMTEIPLSRTPRTRHTITLTGLKPETAYSYQITFFDTQGRKLRTPIEYFRT